ncbi:hypothetical protein [Sporosarcina thermotolerans]
MKRTVYETIICGGGPAGMSQLIYFDAQGQLAEELNRGICVIEKTDELLSGNIKKYKISANSKGGALFEFLSEHSLVQQYLNKEKLSEQIQSYCDIAPSLHDIGVLYGKIGNFLEQCIKQNPNSDVYKCATVEQIHICEEGLFKVVFKQFGCVKEVWAKNVHVNLGGVPKTLNLDEDDRYVHSHYILTEQNEHLEELFTSNDSLKIAIVGNSHSAMSVLSKLNERYSVINSSKYSFDLYGKSNLKLYYSSMEDALLDGYNFTEDDICPVTQRVNRYSGMREESFLVAKAILNETINNVTLKRVYFKDNADYDLIIECLGYKTNLIPVYKNGKQIQFEVNNGILKTDTHFRPVMKNQESIDCFYSYGLGVGIGLTEVSGGEKSFTGNIDGIWLYQHYVAEIITELNKKVLEVI